MKAFIKFDINIVTRKLLEDLIRPFDVKFRVIGFGEIEFLENISQAKIDEITIVLNEYGIEIIENQKSILVQKIKDTISEMVNSEEPLSVKSSVFLAEKLNHSYIQTKLIQTMDFT